VQPKEGAGLARVEQPIGLGRKVGPEAVGQLASRLIVECFDERKREP
jgi:hypothetical protein